MTIDPHTRFRMAESELFRSGGEHFIFMVASSAIFEVSAELAGWLRSTRKKESFTWQELRRMPGLNEPQKSQLHTDLVRLGVLEPMPARVVQRLTPSFAPVPLSTLVLQLTDRCNLGCLYCYHHQAKAGSSFSKGAMSPGVAERAIDYLMDQSADLERVTVVFFGGEPLLNFGVMAHAVSHARQRARQRGKSVDFALTTNAVCLTPRIVSYLHDNAISVTVSMDGFDSVHDRYRCFPDGSPSHRIVAEGVRALLRPPSRPFVARVTLARDAVVQVPQILAYLLKLGFVEAGFAPVTTARDGIRLTAADLDALLDQFRLLAAELVDAARQHRFLGFTNLIDLLVAFHQGERKSHPCGAGLGLLAADPEGDLFLCQRLIGEKEAQMGNIFHGCDADRLARFREQGHQYGKAACRACWVRNLCAGGCYHEAFTRQGRLTAHNAHYCQWLRRWIRLGLETYGQLASECPEFLDRLAVSRGVRLSWVEPV